jgi:hypothetical protein
MRTARAQAHPWASQIVFQGRLKIRIGSDVVDDSVFGGVVVNRGLKHLGPDAPLLQFVVGVSVENAPEGIFQEAAIGSSEAARLKIAAACPRTAW